MLNTKKFTLTTVLALGLLTAATSFSGCTSTSSTSSSESAKPNSKGSQKLSSEDYQTALNDCLRDNGVNVQDGRDGSVGFEIEGADTVDLIKNASKECESKLGPAPVDANSPSDAEQQKMNQKVVDCFRGRGYSVPDAREGDPIQIPKEVSETDAQECLAGLGS